MAKHTILLALSYITEDQYQRALEQLRAAALKHGGSIRGMAAELGIPRGTFYRFLKERPHFATMIEDIRAQARGRAESPDVVRRVDRVEESRLTRQRENRALQLFLIEHKRHPTELEWEEIRTQTTE